MPQFFGAKLKYARQHSGLTQAELATQVGLAAYTHVSKLEGGQRVPSLELVTRIAAALHISADYLLRDSTPTAALTPLLAHSDTHILSSLGARVQHLRLREGWSQTLLAENLGISRAFLSNIEAGRKLPSIDLVVHIADLLDTNVDNILFATEH